MPVEERLHHVLRRHRLPHHFFAGHGGAPFQHQPDRLPLYLRGRQSDSHHVASRRNHRARQRHSARRVLERERDGIRESILAQRVYRERHVRVHPPIHRRRRHPQFEIGPRRADAQTIGVLRPALLLGVADRERIVAAGGQRHHETRIGMVRLQTRAFVRSVVVERQLIAASVGQPQYRIQRRIEPSRVDLGHHRLAGAAFEAKNIPLARPIDAPVHHHGQLDPFGVLRHFRQRLHLERLACHLVNPRSLAARVESHVLPGQIPTAQFHRGARSRPPAERENIRHERQLADGDAIDKVFPSAIQRIAYLDGVFAIGGRYIVDRGVGMEAEIVVVGHFFSLGVVERQHGLEPAGNRVGQIGHQLARTGGDREALSLPCRKAVAIGVARRERTLRPPALRLGESRLDAPVDDGRQCNGHVGGRLRDL